MEEKKKLKIPIILLVLLILVIVAVVAIIALNQTDKEKVDLYNNVANSDFSIKFLKLENNKENLVYSPLSIKYGLKMLSEGASGNTKVQIENLIKDLTLTKYHNIDKVLSLANTAYIKDTFKDDVKEDYRKTLIKNYAAEINYDSFENVENINKWIENKTLGIIKNMLRDDFVRNPDLRMLLINALAIDMEWQIPFDASDTKGRDFYLANGDKMLATTMNNEVSNKAVSYYTDKKVTALAMDLKKYEDAQLQFLAIMPEKDLSDYIEKLTMDDINNIINNLELSSNAKDGIEIYIPRFSFDYDLKLETALINLGITDAFDPKAADFSNISDEELYVSDALHKADIDFTERGVKAAAVTIFAMESTTGIGVKPEPEKIVIDKPFLYLIRDKKNGEIWFVGTLYEPNSWENDKAEY